MIYELRPYRIAPGRMADCHAAFAEVLVPLLERLGTKAIGFWEAEEGSHNFYYLLAFGDADERNRVWQQVSSDGAWQARKAAFGESPPWTQVDSIILTPTSYSPLH